MGQDQREEMRAAVVAAQCLRPITAVGRSFHNSVSLSFPKDSPYIEAMRQYKAQLSDHRKIFQAGIDAKVSQQTDELGKGVEEARAQVAERKAHKAARGAESRALNREMHLGMRAAKTTRIRKGQKQVSKQAKKAQKERASALGSLNSSSNRTIWSEEQIAQSINEDTLRPYYPSFLWKPLETEPFSVSEHERVAPVRTAGKPHSRGNAQIPQR